MHIYSHFMLALGLDSIFYIEKHCEIHPRNEGINSQALYVLCIPALVDSAQKIHFTSVNVSESDTYLSGVL